MSIVKRVVQFLAKELIHYVANITHKFRDRYLGTKLSRLPNGLEKRKRQKAAQ